MLFIQKMGEELTSLLSTKISTSLRRAFMSANRNSSITRMANTASIAFPLLAVDSVPRDVVTDIAKAVEVKLAMDVKMILERVVSESAKHVDYNGAIAQIPFRGLFKNEEGVVSVARDAFGTAGAATYANLVAESYAAAYCNTLLQAEGTCVLIKADVDTIAEKLIAEAPNDFIIKDRNAAPTYVKISLKYINEKNEIKEVEHLLSVECIPRYVNANELKVRLSAYNPARMFKRFIQLSNKEISFLRDFMLDVDMVKSQAKDAAYKGIDNQIFSVIERNHKIRDMGINVYPFLCVLLSKDFVEDVIRTERLDIKRDFKQVMKKFFAMGLFVYNESTELVDVAYDGNTKMETYPLDDIASETSKYEKELKQIVKMYK